MNKRSNEYDYKSLTYIISEYKTIHPRKQDCVKVIGTVKSNPIMIFTIIMIIISYVVLLFLSKRQMPLQLQSIAFDKEEKRTAFHSPYTIEEVH